MTKQDVRCAQNKNKTQCTTHETYRSAIPIKVHSAVQYNYVRLEKLSICLLRASEY